MGSQTDSRVAATAATLATEQALAGLYAGIQHTALVTIKRILERMTPTPNGEAAAFRQAASFIRQITLQVATRRQVLVESLIREAASAGSAEAEAQAGRLPELPYARLHREPSPPRPPMPPTHAGAIHGPQRPHAGDLNLPMGVRAAALIRADLSSELQAVEMRLTRLPEDVFKEVAGKAAIQNVIANGISPHEAMAYAWRDFVGKGVTGFEDAAGRRWNIASYTEMAVRTASTRAYNASLIEVATIKGIDLFTVPPHRDPCPLCAPWEGCILSVTPNPGASATIEEATQAGLFHPNCRHTLAMYLPGYSTRPRRTVWDQAAQARYDATQKQRALERQIRRLHQQAATSLSPLQAATARGQIRDLQARLRRLIAENDNLAREPMREKPNLGFTKG